MSRINNPRFPHHCRIIRYAATGPMEDQSNVCNQTTDYNPLEDEIIADSNGVNPEKSALPNDVRVIYEGVCRSYNRDAISDNGEVITSYRTLALPLKQDEWTEDTMPMEGDKIELQRFGYMEYGDVIDKEPSNLGTHITWKYVRN